MFLQSPFLFIGNKMQSNQNLSFSSDFTLLPIGSAPNYTGYGAPLTDSGQHGITLSGKNNYHIHDIQFSNIAGSAVDIQSSVGGWQHVGYLSKISVINSYCGFKLSNYAEYETVSDCNAANCIFGFVVDSGNNSFSNCKASFCSIGVKISGGANNGHGVWNGLLANHCTYNLSCQNVSLGESFNGCCFIGGQSGSYDAGGGIQIINSKGINLTGGQIGFVDVTIDATSQVSLVGVTLRGTVNFTVAAGATLSAKGNIVVPGSGVTLNGAAWTGNN